MIGGTIPAIAAANRKKKQELEEEQMGYGREDLNGWEFKIVRSITGRFESPEAVKQLCEEESMAGWELLEKFDDKRIRFKRRTENRGAGHGSGIDPYRTSFGISEGRLVITVLAVIGALALLIALTAIIIRCSCGRGGPGRSGDAISVAGQSIAGIGTVSGAARALPRGR